MNNDKEKRGRGRPKGSKNNPKFISVSVKDITRVFHPDSIIQIDIKYAAHFNKQETIILNLPENGIFGGTKVKQIKL